MGIRIHKVLGYAIDNIKTDPEDIFKITDERINLKGYLGLDCDAQEKKYKINDFKKYIEKKKNKKTIKGLMASLTLNILNDESHQKNKNPKYLDINRSVVHEPEYGFSNVLVITPLTNKHWQRYDDDIDYVENNFLCDDPQNPMEPTIKVLDYPLYPWNHYINKRTEIKGKGKNIFGNNVMFIKKLLKDEKMPEEEMSILLQENGFEDRKDFEENLMPAIADEVVWLCDFLKIFKNKENIYDLRPAIYTYWG